MRFRRGIWRYYPAGRNPDRRAFVFLNYLRNQPMAAGALCARWERMDFTVDSKKGIVMDFDSSEEMYFSWWLQQLQDAGIVARYSRSESFTLSEKVDSAFSANGKTKSFSLFRPHVYTPDFRIEWRAWNGEGLLWVNHDSNRYTEKPGKDHLRAHRRGCFVSYVEVKPANAGASRGRFHETRSTKTDIKWVYQRFGIFINYVEIGNGSKPTAKTPSPALPWFGRTFCPDRYLLTDKTAKPRSINFPVRTLGQFLSEKPNLINQNLIEL